MSIRITNLRIPIDKPDGELPNRLARTLHVSPADLQGWRILRKSLDVRDKRDLQFVYTAEVMFAEDEENIARRARQAGSAQVELFNEPPFEMPAPGAQPLRHPPVVIGSGPAGLVAAYFLAQQGYQ